MHADGLPRINVPGFHDNGLPLGIQIVGRFGRDHAALEAALFVERAIGGDEIATFCTSPPSASPDNSIKRSVIDLVQYFHAVMPALVAGIHVLEVRGGKDVDGRDKPGDDEITFSPRLQPPR